MRLFLKQKGPYTSSPCSIKLWQSPDQQVPSDGLMAEFSLGIFVKEQSGTPVLSHAKETVQKPCCLCTMLRGAISYPFPDRAGSMQLAKIHSPTQPRNYSANNFAKTLSLSLLFEPTTTNITLFKKWPQTAGTVIFRQPRISKSVTSESEKKSSLLTLQLLLFEHQHFQAFGVCVTCSQP